MEVVAPISAPMLQIVPIPANPTVRIRLEASPLTCAGNVVDAWAVVFDDGASPSFDCQNSSNLLKDAVADAGVLKVCTLQMTSFGDVHLDIFPFSRTPMTLGAFNSHGNPAMTSTASAPPTPTAHDARPPALGV